MRINRQPPILDMGDPIRIYDLAVQMIHLAGFRPNLDIPSLYSSPA